MFAANGCNLMANFALMDEMQVYMLASGSNQHSFYFCSIKWLVHMRLSLAYQTYKLLWPLPILCRFSVGRSVMTKGLLWCGFVVLALSKLDIVQVFYLNKKKKKIIFSGHQTKIGTQWGWSSGWALGLKVIVLCLTKSPLV